MKINQKINFREKMLLQFIAEKISLGLGKSHEGQMWIPCNGKQLSELFACSERTIRYSISKLCAMGLFMKRQLANNPMDRTNYFSVAPDFAIAKTKETFASSIVQKLQPAYMDINNYNNKSHKSYKSERKRKFLESSPAQTSPKTRTASDMLAVWNEEFGRTDCLNLQRSRFLVAAFQRKFEHCLQKWREYLKLIKTSAHLAYEKFRVSLDEILKFHTINTILGDKSYGKDPQRDQMSDALQHIDSVAEDSHCSSIRKRVLRKHGAARYLSWMTRISLGKNANSVRVAAESPFVRDYAMQNFLLDFPECMAT
ncbi:MAG: hypothetical protein LBG20_04460 [Holosporaceae bacterium]|jgi:hypothetical protein|nr:hypothetical protein [Holosporaceae bacterium]